MRNLLCMAVVAVALLGWTEQAHAGLRVSVSVGTPVACAPTTVVYTQPQAVVYQPQVVYTQPQAVVYHQPQPVYYEPQPRRYVTVQTYRPSYEVVAPAYSGGYGSGWLSVSYSDHGHSHRHSHSHRRCRW